MYHIGGNTYQLIKDHKNAWNFEVFRERYSEVLDRYDYIVGDWGYNQLRLKGFFKENQNKGAKDASITHLHDYLNEYCNFGCAYFIVEKQPARKNQPARERAEDEAAEGEIAAVSSFPASEEPTAADKQVESASDLKPRQHYHRAGTENRHKAAQERWGDGRGIPNEGGKPKNPEAKSRMEEGRNGGEPKGRGPDNRPKEQESRGRGQEGNKQRNAESRKPDQRLREQDPRPKAGEQQGREQENRGNAGGRQRFQEQRGGKNQQQQASGEQKAKGQVPRDQQQQPSGKNKPHDRNRNRNREAEKEKAEPRY